MAKALVIGGGIVGLSSAYYLLQSGWQVTVADRGDFTNNCSYGNAGYICPSHFVPLASPGIIKQGLRWMLNPQSPFYIKPRLNWGLLQWGWQFMRSATPAHLQRSEVPLRDIALLSKQLYEEWLTLPGFEFAYERKGLLEYFQTPEKEAAAHHHAHAAAALGLEAKVLTAAETQTLEPHVDLNVKGALYFGCDAHLHPNRVMQQMHAYLKNAGVEFLANSPVTSFEKQGGKVMAANAGKTRLQADIMVVASGSWSRQVAHALGLNLLLVGGRGYSFTFNHGHLPLQYPAVLMEGRVALTPFGDGLVRLGGTMEITNLDEPPQMNRVTGILKAAQQYYPQAQIPQPTLQEVWYGYRPCSADGLPYIGRINHLPNVIIATGHAMVGMSLGAATGKLVAELAAEQSTSMNMAPFSPHRFE